MSGSEYVHTKGKAAVGLSMLGSLLLEELSPFTWPFVSGFFFQHTPAFLLSSLVSF